MRKMKSFLQIAIIAIFAASNLIGISTSVAAGRKRPHVTRNNNVMILEYDFEEPHVFTKDDFDFVTIDGLDRYFKPGTPIIPAKPVEILVPAGMKIADITSVAIDTYQLPDTYRLSHGQKKRRRPPYGKKFEPSPPTPPDPEIFGMTKFWPVQQHDLVTVQINRGYEIAHVNLFPLQYSPKTGKIKMTAKMRLRIRLAPADSHHRAKPTKYLKQKLERELDNPDAMESYDTDSAQALSPPPKGPGDPPPLDDLPGAYQYIVITNETLEGYSGANSFQDLCDSKIARGISAGIVNTEWIYANYTGTDNPEKVRNFLIDAYQAWGTEYALLGGDKDIIPIRKLHSDGEDIPADMYYGCVDPPECTFNYDGDGKYGESNDGVGGGEVDLTAEIFIGRAAVANSTDVANFVNKTLVYGSTSDPYLDYALCGGAHLWGEVYNKPFAELIRLGSDLFLGHHTYGFEDAIVPNARDFAANMTLLYEEDGPWDASDLIPILNGTGGNTTPQMMYIADHGSTYSSMANKMGISDLSSLNNTRPFFYYDDSCYCGAFDENNCFGEVVTTMQYGAFGCILNSRYGWGSSTEYELDSPTTQVTREFFHSIFGEGAFELGRALLEGKERCIWRLWYTRYDIYQATLFGDPELQLRVTSGPDETAPTPDPMTFATPPYATGSDSIALVATTASDYSGVEYYFTCTAGGGNDSGWQSSTSYTDTGLLPRTTYTYTVTARDLSPAQNTTGASGEASATTDVYCSTCGDLDGAGVNVDLVDYALFVNCWGENPLTNLDCVCANLVEFDDHEINLFDLCAFAELFLSSSEFYPPNNCSTSITDPYAPTPDPMSFATPPYATGHTSIAMVATTAADVSGVEYYFTCTSGGGNNSGWQASPTYEDTGLSPETTCTYTVKARDLSVNYNETAASAGASATTDEEPVVNVVLPANGGNLDSFTSEYGDGWVASDLTNGVTNEDGWSSEKDPGTQEFIFSFSGGNNATLDEAVIHGGLAEGGYYSKDVEVWTSANGTSYTIAGSDTLLDENNDSVTIDLGGVVAKKIKLVVTSGYRSDYWELAEFEVYGVVID